MTSLVGADDETVERIALALSRSTSTVVTPNDIFKAGLVYAGFDQARQAKNNEERKIRWFNAFYGIGPTTIAAIFEDIRYDASKRVTAKGLLMALNWLFLYETYPVLSGRWKFSEEYIAKSVVEYGLLLAKLSREKIVFELKDNIALGRTVDCVNFTCQEMRLDPSSKWFDHKSNSCGLKYEFCLATREPRIVWISGPHLPSTHDIVVLRGGTTDNPEGWDGDALYFQLKKDEWCIGDSGYAGEPDKVIVAKDEHPPELRQFIARAKNRQETFHTRLKSFNILGHRFRHGSNTDDTMRLHKIAVYAIATIIQYDYENGHPPFDIC